MTEKPDNNERRSQGLKPWQFTVRAFFGAAVLFVLFFCAATRLRSPWQDIAFLVLVWSVVAWLYLRIGAIRSLLALAIGPVFVVACALPLLVAGEVYRFKGIQDNLLTVAIGSMASVVVILHVVGAGLLVFWAGRRRLPLVALGVGPAAIALVWGAHLLVGHEASAPARMRDLLRLTLVGFSWSFMFSLLVASLGGLKAYRARRRLQRLADTSAEGLSQGPWRPSRRGLRLGIALAALHTALVGVVGLALLGGFDWTPLVMLLDAPVMSGYRTIARLFDLPRGLTRNLASYLFFGGLLHFGVGWLIGYGAAVAQLAVSDGRPPQREQQDRPIGS